MTWWVVWAMTLTVVAVTRMRTLGAGMGDADAEVVDPVGVAQGEFAAVIGGVAADAEVFGGVDGWWGGFGQGGVGLRGCGAWW